MFDAVMPGAASVRCFVSLIDQNGLRRMMCVTSQLNKTNQKQQSTSKQPFASSVSRHSRLLQRLLTLGTIRPPFLSHGQPGGLSVSRLECRKISIGMF